METLFCWVLKTPLKHNQKTFHALNVLKHFHVSDVDLLYYDNVKIFFNQANVFRFNDVFKTLQK